VTSKQKKEDLVRRGVELEHTLNQLTEQAELAVQHADPATSFHLATNKDSSTSAM